MSTRFPQRWLAALPQTALLLTLAAGCSVTMPRYTARETWPHKDVALIAIEVEQRLTPEEYLLVVERERAKLPLIGPQGDPLYEVRFEFYLAEDEARGRTRRTAPSALVARVAVAIDGPDQDASVTLY